jgi:hypothetical protein
MSPTIRQRSMIFSMDVPRGSTRPFQTRHRDSKSRGTGRRRLAPENLAFRIRETLEISCSYTATADLKLGVGLAAFGGQLRSRSRKEMFPECIPVATLDRVIVPKWGANAKRVHEPKGTSEPR